MRQGIFRWKATAKPKHRVSLRQAAIGGSVAPVPRDSLLERCDALVEFILCPLVEVVPALQIVVVRFRVDWTRRCQVRAVLGRKVHFDLLNDALGELLLYFENTPVISLVLTRPNVFVCG